ncbi:hypothetical protein BLNAU_3760 [Blattamonas nauphoetae]|uniref:Macro domain-containing protein n=1 Tax=Blattamonas nauphoetae TaxID=2049346 RepID=A0ABQ9YC63_9EUKA|nr:hypothetical protein BLNAU_3760 [Blattamonas nauphoetae]
MSDSGPESSPPPTYPDVSKSPSDAASLGDGTEGAQSPMPDDDPIVDLHSPTLKARTMADFPGKGIQTPRIPIFPPSDPIPQYGTTIPLQPGLASSDLMTAVEKDYANMLFVTSLCPNEQQMDESGEKMVPVRRLAATLGVGDTPPQVTADGEGSKVSLELSKTPYGLSIEPRLQRSLAINTPQFKGATSSQLMVSYLQDLSMPSKVVSCDSFLCWTDYVSTWTYEHRQKLEEKTSIARFANLGYYRPEIDIEEDINQRVFVVQGDITAIECDGIINITDEHLHTDSLPSQAILARGGPNLKKKFKQLVISCGECRATAGYGLKAKNVIHVAIPLSEQPTLLRSAVDSALTMAVDNDMKSVCLPAFCIEGYPRPSNKTSYPLIPSTHVMMRTIRRWMDTNWQKLSHLILVASCPREFNVFVELMLDYFPCLPTAKPKPPPEPEPPKEEPRPTTKKKKKGKKGKKGKK